MRFRLGCVGAALVAGAIVLAVTPVSAKAAESRENSSSAFADFTSRLKVESQWVLAATAKAAVGAIEQSKSAIADAEKDLAPSFESFRLALNEQKARLDIIGQHAAQRLKAWQEAAAKAWDENWSGTWARSWTEIQRSAMETLDRFRDWIAKQSVSDEQTETPV